MGKVPKKLAPLLFADGIDPLTHDTKIPAVPGEACVIPYCARAKRELQALMQQRQQQGALNGQRTMCPCAMPGMMGAAGASASGVAGLFGGGGGVAAPNGLGMGLADPATVHQHAHYLLVLAHVMKCTNHECAVPECKPTKDLVTNHTRSCRAGDACLFPRCALSKKLMRHHRECPDQACAICLPLRRRLAAAKMGAVASAAPQQQPIRRKPNKRKKGEDDDDDDGHPGEVGGAKRKRKADAANGQGGRGGGGGSKKGRHSAQAAAVETQEVQMTAEQDVLECGFSVSVLFPTGRRGTGEDTRGEWRSGVVMRAYTSPHDEEPVYDIMMHSGTEEKVVAHNRCRMVCGGCLTDKRVFKPPPMFCEKCFTAIHQRWSYWEEEGDEGGVKLCKRCYADIRGAANPDKMLHELVRQDGLGRAGAGHNMSIDRFIEKKEKDRPEYVDNWVQCDECHAWLHWTCALYKGEDTPDDCLFFCEECRETRAKQLPKELVIPTSTELPETKLSEILQKNLASELKAQGITCAPVTVRVVSNIETSSKIEEIGASSVDGKKGPNGKVHKEFPYRSKCILAFQRVQGHEICFFAMYVQEYGSDCPEPNTNRVYISYLDSVRYFESSPEGQRTFVYHSILVNYLGYAKELGYTHGHIWVSPPKQGDDYIFYAHPEVMLSKRMGLLKLKEWYEKMLDVAKARRIVVDYQDMLEEYKDIESASDIPIFSGDHWAASITNKIVELNKKVNEANAGKKKDKAPERKTDASNKAGQAAAAAGSSSGGAGSSAAKAVPMTADKQEETILNQITEEMRSMRNHFIVVTLNELKKGQKAPTIVDPVPLMSNEFVDTRSAFLEKCQMCAAAAAAGAARPPTRRV